MLSDKTRYLDENFSSVITLGMLSLCYLFIVSCEDRHLRSRHVDKILLKRGNNLRKSYSVM